MELPEVDCLLEQASQQLQVRSSLAVHALHVSCMQTKPAAAADHERCTGRELLFDDAFSMFEAMSAIEIGDPKLDAGVPSQAGPRY